MSTSLTGKQLDQSGMCLHIWSVPTKNQKKKRKLSKKEMPILKMYLNLKQRRDPTENHNNSSLSQVNFCSKWPSEKLLKISFALLDIFCFCFSMVTKQPCNYLFNFLVTLTLKSGLLGNGSEAFQL